MSNKQIEVMNKMRDRAWKAENYITNPDEGNAFIMRVPGAVAIVYPDGTLDRQMTPNANILWRKGYRDLRADARRQATEENNQKKLEILLPKVMKLLYAELGGQ